ncbi:phosphoglycerol transferase MdoB-like AlkP superfamily enzyme [Actinoplanes lutulentus]|uniref:Phosphoglycerol transferase MdoB-like AlkP superfamily enzyme n=1 Tax=Actinoplanes lutulentus TaxID=1287878 RepID=A0A327Z5G7_9ACTN|nr:phosphoglycerol transferase MdoB-like AlkP superfamily enzyme [Actinoplanes lutulentus]
MNHLGGTSVPHVVQPTDLADPPADETVDTPAETTEEKPDETPEDEVAAASPPKEPGRVRRFVSHPRFQLGLTILAGVIVFAALVYPNVLKRLTLGGFARIPIEAAVAIAVFILLPRRPRKVVAIIAGMGLGWLLVEKSLDMGWFETLNRPFDPVLDWILFDDTYGFIRESYGQASAYAVAAGAVLLAVAALALTTWAVLRLSSLIGRHRRVSAYTAGGITALWLVALLTGIQVVPKIPVAARSSATYAYDRARQAKAGIGNNINFKKEIKNDPFADTPGDQLLTGLAGKDVIFSFVESYGRNAVEAPELAPGVDAVLDKGTTSLTQAGFAARSGWLTSPTFGGNSWLAHSTLLSGLWINNQSRYRNLTASDRLTLTSAFKRAQWDTVSVMPGATRAWPEGKFYGYNRVWDSRNLGYQGPKFSWAPMPDQYTLKKFNEVEYGKAGRQPLMVEMPLVSSHTPWAPIPSMLDWDAVGDGSVYNDIVKDAPKKSDIWGSTSKVRAEYGKSIQYTLTSLIEWVQKYGDDNLVLVYLGDHQPSKVVSGENASHDVPITVIAKDPAVLDKIKSWGWTDGLKPATDAPVWPMSDFRDKFLNAYGPNGTNH